VNGKEGYSSDSDDECFGQDSGAKADESGYREMRRPREWPIAGRPRRECRYHSIGRLSLTSPSVSAHMQGASPDMDRMRGAHDSLAHRVDIVEIQPILRNTIVWVSSVAIGTGMSG
jgi:hypothetical protein